jgi:hypothetical protein
MNKFAFLLLISSIVLSSFSQEKRDLLQNKAKEIGIEKLLIKDFSELDFPTYYNRDFWENVPDALRKKYIQEAEQFLDYDWPVVKAADYPEIIRSGRRNLKP